MRLLTIAFCLFLSACGFTPMYGTQGTTGNSVTAELDQISIAVIPNREGQFLRNALIDRFYKTGTPTSPAYHLKVAPIRESISDFDITVDSEATRRQLRLSTSMTLIDVATNERVLTRSMAATTSHNVLQSEFSTLVTEQSARESALTDLARKIEQQVALYLSR